MLYGTEDILAGPSFSTNIFFAFSTDNGQTFSTPHNLSNNTQAGGPQISSSGNNVYVVWAEQVPSGPFSTTPDIFFAFSTDNGQTFSTPDNLSENTGASFNPQISSSGNNVYVVWEDSTFAGGDSDVFFAFSKDNGQTFILLITSVRLREIPLFHKSLLQEIMFMLYGQMEGIQTLTPFLHSVQIMA